LLLPERFPGGRAAQGTNRPHTALGKGQVTATNVARYSLPVVRPHPFP